MTRRARTAGPSTPIAMRVPTLILCLALAAGCSAGGAPGAASPAPRNPDVITAQELASVPYSNAYDAIQRLRPQMLQPRGGSATSSLTQEATYGVKVYLDGVPVGGLDDLKDIPLSGIKEIRYLNATDATQRFGTGNPGGAIMIRTH